jgi:hypothetical protein
MLDVPTEFIMTHSSFSLIKPVRDKYKVFSVHAMKAIGRMEV